MRYIINLLICVLLLVSLIGSISAEALNTQVKQNQFSKFITFYEGLFINRHQKNVVSLQKLARSYAHADQHEKAINVYKELLKADTKNRVYYLTALGWQYLWSGKPKDAFEYFKAATLLDPTNKDAQRGLYESKHPRVYQARILIKKGEWREALAKLKPFLDSSDPGVQLDIARVYANLGQHKQAIKYYEKRLRGVGPNYQKEVVAPLAYQYLWAYEFKQSKQFFEEYLTHYPHDERARQGLFEASHPDLVLARIARNQHQTQASINHYIKLIQQYPNNVLFLRELAQAYKRDDDPLQAMEIYHQLIYHYRDKSSYLSYAWLLLWSGHPKKARHFFLLAKQQGEDLEQVTLGLMDAQSTIQNNAIYTLQTLIYAYQIKAAKDYAWKILRREPKNESWYLEVAHAFSAAGYNKPSRKILLKGIQASPKNKLMFLPALAWNNYWLGNKKIACNMFLKLKNKTESPLAISNALGYCIDNFKGHKAAIRYYKNLSKDKNNDEYTEWQLQIAYFYIMRREYEKATIVLKNILKTEPYNLGALVEYGNTLAFHDYNMQAVRWYKTALKTQPTNPDLQAHLARAYYWLDMGDKSLATYAKPVAMRPKSYYMHWDSAKRAFSNRIYISYNHLTNSDGLSNNATLLEWQHYLSGRTSLNSFFNFGYLKGAVDSGSWETALFGFKTYYGGVDTSYGILYSQAYIGAGSYLGWRPFLWDLSANWRKSDHWSVLFQTKDIAVLDSLAQGHRILFGYLSVEPTYFSDPWLVQLRLLGGRYSDNNNRALAGLDILRDVYRPYAVYIGPSIEYFANSNPNESHGYYNPRHYTELAFIVKGDLKLAEKWYLYPYIKLGVFNDDTNTTFKQQIYDARLRLAYRINLYQDLSVQASYFNSGSGGFSGGGGGDGYNAFSFSVDYHYFFK